MVDEELQQENEEEELEDDGKIHFPKSGLFLIGGIIFLMIICIVLILVLRK